MCLHKKVVLLNFLKKELNMAWVTGSSPYNSKVQLMDDQQYNKQFGPAKKHLENSVALGKRIEASNNAIAGSERNISKYDDLEAMALAKLAAKSNDVGDARISTKDKKKDKCIVS